MHVYPTFVANNIFLLLGLTTVLLALKYLAALLVWSEVLAITPPPLTSFPHRC